MRGPAICAVLFALAPVNAVGWHAQQETVDRIAARVENDIILVSDIRALSHYQQFVDGQSETDAQILDRLIDQWIVRTEAGVARFPHPSDAEIERSLERVKTSFPSARSEEHTSELQSLRHLVCRLLLEKKKESRKS